MEEYPFTEFKKKFDIHPEDMMEQMQFNDLKKFSNLLDLEFFPPFPDDHPEDDHRNQIIMGVLGDFENEKGERMLIDAFVVMKEYCMNKDGIDPYAFTKEELTELNRRVSDPNPKFASEESITAIFGKPFLGNKKS